MSERKPDNKRLRNAFSSVDPPPDSTVHCAGDEEIWAASRGELSPERTRFLLAHSLECADCKQSWLAAAILAAEGELNEIGPSGGSDAARDTGVGQVIPFRSRHHRLIKGFSAVAATLLTILVLTTVLNREEVPVAPLTLAERIRTDLWRVGEPQPLSAGDRLRTGDRIYLTLESDLPVHLYVINMDEAGDSAALFPIPDAQWSNPLPPGEAHRLPGGSDWQYDSWEVSSAGGRESFTVIAALEPLQGLESALALLDAAVPQDQFLRGRSAAPPGSETDPARAAAALAEALQELRGESSELSVAIRELVLENPRSPDS